MSKKYKGKKKSSQVNFSSSAINIMIVAAVLLLGYWIYDTWQSERSASKEIVTTMNPTEAFNTANKAKSTKKSKSKKTTNDNADKSSQQNKNSKAPKQSANSLSTDDRLLIVITENSLQEQLVNYEGFKVSFNKKLHIPNWVAWELTDSEVAGSLRRGNDFHRDAKVDGCPDPWDYKNSGYDKGHMAPAGDMKWNGNAMYDCFSMANMCPQASQLNQGSWRVLEEKCREWAKKFGNIFIICGPVNGEREIEKIGDTKVSVPKRFFKVIIAPYASPAMGIGFIMPNAQIKGGIKQCAVTIDEIEALTGHDFFASLPDKTENAVESQCDFYKWEK